MCFGGGSTSTPKVQKAPTPPAIVAPIEADASAAAAGEQERKRRRAASGRSDTILTGSLGDASAPNVGGNRLLGQ